MLPDTGAERLSARAALSDLFLTYVSEGNVMQVEELFERPEFRLEEALQTASPIHIAVQNRDYAMLQLLLDRGVPPTLIDSSDRGTVLHRAAALDEPGAIRLAVGAGCPIDSVDARGMTPLHVAAYWGCAAAAQALLELGATADALDGLCKPPRYWSDSRGHAGVSRLLPEYRLDWTMAVRQAAPMVKKMKVTKVPKPKKKKKSKKR